MRPIFALALGTALATLAAVTPMSAQAWGGYAELDIGSSIGQFRDHDRPGALVSIRRGGFIDQLGLEGIAGLQYLVNAGDAPFGTFVGAGARLRFEPSDVLGVEAGIGGRVHFWHVRQDGPDRSGSMFGELRVMRDNTEHSDIGVGLRFEEFFGGSGGAADWVFTPFLALRFH